MYAFLEKVAYRKTECFEQGSSISKSGTGICSDSCRAKGKNLTNSCMNEKLESELGYLNLTDDQEGKNTAHTLLVELADCVVDLQTRVSDSKHQMQQPVYSCQKLEPIYPYNANQSSSLCSSYSDTDRSRASCSCGEMAIGVGTSSASMEGPSEESPCYHLNNNSWLASDQSKHCSSMDSSCAVNDWGRCGMSALSWGGRVVDRKQAKGYAQENCGVSSEEYDAFVNIFEGGSLLYCNMSFEALLNVRKQLEELGFPCKAVNDGLWLQVCY